MSDGGFTVDPDALHKAALRLRDLAGQVSGIVGQAGSYQLELGQNDAPMFTDGSDLGQRYNAAAGKLINNVTQASTPDGFVGQLNLLAGALAEAAKRYRVAADVDQVSAAEIDQWLFPSIGTGA